MKNFVGVILFTLSAIAMACNNPYEGTYKLIGKDGKQVMGNVTLTIGEKTFALTSGASGNIEATGNKVIFSNSNFAGVFTASQDGKTLTNDKWTLIKE